MAQVMRRGPMAALASINRVHDDKPHTKENALAAATAVFAVVAIVCAFFPSMHILGAWSGLAGVFVGLGGQMISATTLERFVLIISLGASAVGLFINMANGGLY
ncbi:hypothetical protein [Yinghuangia soli]|uniref:Uncharacterized protein n=1 Tax=Yinghuangia soli TaxID=2908204 RepID=A0AA41Q5Y0_9ACTN|nr:hypothetical protein [Yinghuangia soli]MCF2532173.1 hypothetical protein [Yinghuangia soli]